MNECMNEFINELINQVKCNAMDALAHMCQRGDNMVANNLAEMLEVLTLLALLVQKYKY